MLVENPMCVDCGTQAPQRKGDAFVSSSTGWRLTRRKAADGKAEFYDWRCPVCWRTHKARAGEPSPDGARQAIGGRRGSS